MKDKKDKQPLEVQEAALRDEVTRKFPAVYFDRFRLIDNNTTRIAINDISYKEKSTWTKNSLSDDIENLALACRGWIEMYDVRDLSSALFTKLESFLKVIDRDKAVFVFPGEGSISIQQTLPREWLERLNVVNMRSIRRVVSNGNVTKVSVSDTTNAREMINKVKPTSIVVVDDLIASGSTMKAVRQALPAKKVEWFAAAGMMLSPLQNRSRAESESSLDGYTAALTPIIYQGTNGIPAVNSFFTFLGESDRCKTVRQNYMEKYVDDPEAFMESIRSLQISFMSPFAI